MSPAAVVIAPAAVLLATALWPVPARAQPPAMSIEDLGTLLEKGASIEITFEGRRSR